MSTLDLDALKSRWTAQSRELDQQLTLDVDAVRRRLGANTATALERQKRSRLQALVLDAAVFVLAVIFMAKHVTDLPYLLLALPFALFALVAGSIDLREWQALGRVDFAQPLATLRTQYDMLRRHRLQLALAIAQVSTLLWLPLVMVLVQGFFGIDLLRRLHFSMIAVNVGIGLVQIPFLTLIVRWIARRWPDSAALRRFADEVAGRDWQRTSDHLEHQLDFEREVKDGHAEQVLRRSQPALPPAIEALRVAARRRIDQGIVVIVALLLLTGIFNSKHGGDAHALIPGVLLHLCAVGWLIAAILQHDALAGPKADGLVPWRSKLQTAVRTRRALLQSYVAASPLLALALLQVLGLALAATDLWQSLGLALWLGLGLVAGFASALLLRQWRRQPQHFVARLVAVLSLGGQSATQGVLDAAAAMQDTDATLRDAA